MKKRSFVWMVLLFCSLGVAKGQVIKMENGVSIASLNIGGLGYEGTFYPYQMSIGMDYMDRGWYGLSSSIGYLRKGSKEDILFGVEESAVPIEARYSFDYITMNTTFRLKGVTSDNFTLYAGVGPRADIKINNGFKADTYTESIVSSYSGAKSLIIGLKTEVGVDYHFNRYLLGVNFSYLPSFMKPIDAGGVKERTFTAGIVVGYVL